MRILKKAVKKLKRLISATNDIPFYTKDIYSKKKYSIGEYTYGNPNVIFDNKDANLIIGKFCSIADNVTIFLGGNHKVDWITTYPFNVLNNDFPKAKSIVGHPATKGDVIIGNDVWIGYGVTILSGVTIGDGAVVAAGSVVTKSIGPYEIWGGNPSSFIKRRFDECIIENLIKMKWWDWEIEEINNKVGALCSNNYDWLKNDKKNI